IAVDHHRYLRRRSSLLVQSIDFEPDDPSKMRSLCVSDAPNDEFLRLHQCNCPPLNSRTAQTPARSSGEESAYSKVWRLVSSRISGNGNQGAKQRPGRYAATRPVCSDQLAKQRLIAKQRPRRCIATGR
ncbi:MAG: hypothetical protein ACTIJR_14730, partial [Brevibacterium linens]